MSRITRAFGQENMKGSTIVSATTGSVAGSTAGAIIGTTILPIGGTIVGGIVGGVIGGVFFGFSGLLLASEYNHYSPFKFGKGIYSTLNSKIIKKEHPKYGGYGLFATQLIKKGEVIWQENKKFEDTPEYAFTEIAKWSQEKQQKFTHFAYQISETHMKGPNPDLHIDPEDDAANYYNHSCDPSTWYDSYTSITARRDIQPGEEITYDYCCSELNETKKITDCGCGTSLCRKKITRDDWAIPELQEKYKGHFLPHVQYMIDKSKK